MKDFIGRCAVVTGGGGLLGRSMALRFARAGMNIVVSDIHLEGAEAVAGEVEKAGGQAIAVQTDVSDLASVQALADKACDTFGGVHLLCNNAGAVVLKPFEELTPADWTTVLSVQFNGVLNGIHAFLPKMLAQGGDCHIVNTSSMSGVGLASMRQLNAPYVTAKFAVVGLSEVMAASMADKGVGVSVLCPGFTVKAPETVTDETFLMPSAAWYKNNLLNPDQVAEEVYQGVYENRLFIFPHRAGREEVKRHFELMMAGFDQAEKTSPPGTL